MNNDLIKKLVEQLENVSDETIIRSFKNSKDIKITKQLFKHFCSNKLPLAIKIYSNLDVYTQEELKEILYSFIKEEDLSKNVIISLVALGEEYQKRYMDMHQEILDVLDTYDDIIYKTLIDKELHELYLNYISKCYEYKNIIVENAERLKFSDIATNNKALEIIKNLERTFYEKKEYDKLLLFADYTKTIKQLYKTLGLSSHNELYNEIENTDISYSLKFLLYRIDLDELSRLFNWFKYLKEKEVDFHKLIELIITRYRIVTLDPEMIYSRTLYIKESFRWMFNDKDSDNDNILYAEEVYNLFYYHINLFNHLYNKPKYYADFIFKNILNNPFATKNKISQQEFKEKKHIKEKKIERLNGNYIDFTAYKRVNKYLERERDTLVKKVFIFVKNADITNDELFKIYFNSVIKYILPIEDYLSNFNFNGDIFKIYNTSIKGSVDYIDNQLYLNTHYDPIKINLLNSFTEINLNNLCPYLKMSGILSSYNFKTKTFRITDLKWHMNKNRKEEYRELLLSGINSKEDEEKLNEFISIDFVLYCCLKSYDDFLCLYGLYKNKFTDLKDQIKNILNYHLGEKIDNLVVSVLTKYFLYEDKDLIIKEFVDDVESLLGRKKEKQLKDLTNDDELLIFREKFDKIILHYFDQIDKNFKNNIIINLKNKKLLSIFYIKEEVEEEYFELIKDKKYIIEFYKNYPTFINNEEMDINKLNLNNDLKFYITLKIIIRYPSLYNDYKQILIDTFQKDTPYVNWLSNLFLNINLFPNSNLIRIIAGTEYKVESLSDEEKEFAQKWNSIINIEEDYNKYDNLLDLLSSIRNKITDEMLNKVKELSVNELSYNEKLELVPIIKRLLLKSNIKSVRLYLLLTALDKNNPYNMNNKIKYKELGELRPNEIKYLIKMKKSLDNAVFKRNFFFITPLYYTSEFTNLIFSTSNEQLKNILSNYKFHGTINIKEGGNLIRVYLNNRIKESDIKCDVNYFKNLPFKIIPHYDFIDFVFMGKDENNLIELCPIIDFSDDDTLLEKAKNDRSFYDNLDIELKRKVLLHYCRYNIVEAYRFDKENILKEEEYIEIVKLLDLYDYTCSDALYLALIFDNRELFKESLFKSKFLQVHQTSLLDLQEKLMMDNEWELYDKLIVYLKEIHYLNKVFISLNALPILNKRETFKKLYNYDSEDLINNKEKKADLFKYFNLKELNINLYKYYFGQLAYEKYNENTLDSIIRGNYTVSHKELIYVTSVLLKEIILSQEITDKNLYRLKELSKNEAIKNDYLSRKVLLINHEDDKDKIIELYEKYKKLIELNNSESELNFEKITLFSSFFPYLRKDIENLLIDNMNLRKYIKYIQNDKYYIDYMTNYIHNKLNELDAKKINEYSLKVLKFLKELYELELRYNELNLYEEFNTIIYVLYKRNVLFPQLIFVKNYNNILNEKFKKLIGGMKHRNIDDLLNYNKNSYLKQLLLKVFKTYDFYNFIKSKWLNNFIILEDNLNKLSNYYYENPCILQYDLNILNFYKYLYNFELGIINSNNKEIKIKLFMELLLSKNYLWEEFILVEELEDYYKEYIPKLIIDNTHHYNVTPNNALYLRLKYINKTNKNLEKSIKEFKIYTYDNFFTGMKSFFNKLINDKMYEDAYLILMQYIINYPDKALTEEMINFLKSGQYFITKFRNKANEFLFVKVNEVLIKNKKALKLYNFIKYTEDANPYYSTNIFHDMNIDVNYDFIISCSNLNKSQKIYLYMRSILKFVVNFNDYIFKLYEEELKNNEEIKLDLDYLFIVFIYNCSHVNFPINIDIDNTNFSNYASNYVTFKITSAKLVNDKVQFGIKIVDSYINSLEINEDIKKLIEVNNDKPYFSLLKALCINIETFNIEFKNIVNNIINESTGKYILFNEIIFNAMYDIYYTSKVLYENDKYSLLKSLIYLLLNYGLFNDRLLYNKINKYEYIFKNRLDIQYTISIPDTFVFNNLDISKDLENELKRILDIIDDEYKLYIYYVICFKFGYYDVDIELSYNDEVEKMLTILMAELIRNDRNPQEFFNGLGKNNIFNSIENSDEKYYEIYTKGYVKLFNTYIKKGDLDNIKEMINNSDNLKSKENVTFEKEVYSLLSEEEKDKLNKYYNVTFYKDREEKF